MPTIRYTQRIWIRNDMIRCFHCKNPRVQAKPRATVFFNNWKNHPVYFLNWCWCFWCVHTLFMLFAINLLSSHPSWASNKSCRNDLRWETLPNRVAWSLLRGLKVASAEGNFQMKTVLFLAILAFHSSCFRLRDVRKTGKEKQFFLSQRLVYGSCCTFGAWTWVSGGSQSIDIKPWCFQEEGGVLAKDTLYDVELLLENMSSSSSIVTSQNRKVWFFCWAGNHLIHHLFSLTRPHTLQINGTLSDPSAPFFSMTSETGR